jgi:quinol monooxygenase YgiN
MDTPLVLIAHLRARPGKAAELSRSLAALVAPTRREPGCLSYVLHGAADDPALFMLYEVWRGRADLDRHFEEPYLRAFLARQEELLGAPLEMRSYVTLPAA